MFKLQPPSEENRYYAEHLAIVFASYQSLLKRALLDIPDDRASAQQVFEADFALVSHNNACDPIFNYGNRTALELFEFSWNEFVGMPSRFSAEPAVRQERETLLATVSGQGFIENYSGIRIAKSGKRFLIKQAVVWNLFDSQQKYYGQAAFFKDWNLEK